jgi:hypothetical protein
MMHQLITIDKKTGKKHIINVPDWQDQIMQPVVPQQDVNIGLNVDAISNDSGSANP